MKVKNLAKRSLASLLALVMCFGMLNLTAFADVGDGQSAQDDNVVYACGNEAHTHDYTDTEDGCFVWEWVLTCTLSEHTHGEGCYEDPADTSGEDTADESNAGPADESDEESADESDENSTDESDEKSADKSDEESTDESNEESADESNEESADESDEESADESDEESDAVIYVDVADVPVAMAAMPESIEGGSEDETDDSSVEKSEGVLTCTLVAHTHSAVGGSCYTRGITTQLKYEHEEHTHTAECIRQEEPEDENPGGVNGVTTEEELRAAIEAAGTEPATIMVTESFDLTNYVWIKEDQNITLTSENGTAIIRGNSYMSYLFFVSGALTLDNITVDGNNVQSQAPAIYVANKGTFTMEDGAVVQNNVNDYTGTTKYYGGGVLINNGGTFVMNGGSITGNTADSYGGGVANKGSFIMNGGEISGNTNPKWYGGGVYNTSTFTMNGGTISENTASNKSYGYGGGVYNSKTFTIKNGAVISNNKANRYGGGVYNADSGTVVLESGTISDNELESTSNYAIGGGVYNNGDFTMKSGSSIAANKAQSSSWSYGGGVYNTGTFTMEGGAIDNNFAGYYGGGVFNEGGSFTMENGEISDNSITTTSNSWIGGGGVHNKNGTFTMNGGEISRNTANSTSWGKGGGVYNEGTGTVTLEDAVIKNNVASYGGGGVHMDDGSNTSTSSGSLTVISGALYKNTGGMADGTLAANDFYAASGAKCELPEASNMVDGDKDLSKFGYVWQGESGENGEYRLTASSDTDVDGDQAFAKIGNTEYTTLAEAVEAANPGDVITVVDTDAHGIAPVTVDKDITIQFEKGQKLLSLSQSGKLFTVKNGATLTLLATAADSDSTTVKLGGKIIIESGGTLAMDGSVTANHTTESEVVGLTIDVQTGSTFIINGQLRTVNPYGKLNRGEIYMPGYNYYIYSSGSFTVNLAKGTYITAGTDFSCMSNMENKLVIKLDSDTLAEFNSDNAVGNLTLVKGTDDANFPSKLDIPGITNKMVSTVADDGDIVLYKLVLPEGPTVGGSGADYRSFAEALEAAKKKGFDTVYVTGQLTGSGEWDGDLGNGKTLTLKRYPVYNGTLVNVSGRTLTLSNITLDGSSEYPNQTGNGPLVFVQSNGTVTLNSGAVLQNNNVSKSNNSHLYPKHGGGVNILSGTLKMNEGAKIENCTAEYGGAVAITSHSGHMYMYGGEITNNTATVSGGGIAASNAYTSPQYGHVLDVLGGTFTYNHANLTGGAIYVQCSNEITIGSPEYHNGEIQFKWNTADGGDRAFAGGALYVNGGSDGYINGKAQLYNVIITNNESTGKWDTVKASYQGGGGIASCVSGQVTIYLTDGAAIYGNKGPNGANDILTTSINHNDGMAASGSSNVKISPIMLGGGAYNWRYTSNGIAVPLDYLTNSNKNLNIYSGVIEGSEAIKAANDLAGVIFENNTGHKLGGAIGTNGDIVIGTAPTEETEKTRLSVEKVWSDGNEKHEGDEIEVLIQREFNGETETFTSVYLSKSNEWKVTVEGLPAGTYSVKEAGEQNGVIKIGENSYKVTYTPNGDDSFTITNTYEPETPPPPTTQYTSLTVEKVWVGDNDEVRPESITVVLLRNGTAYKTVTLNEANNWSHRWTGLSASYTWTVQELEVDGYESNITRSGNTFTITNTYVEPEPETVSVTVSKVWDDEDDADGIRPESVEVQLLKDGEAYGEPVTLDESNGWSYIWSDLDAEYDYQVIEVNVPDGYTASVTNDGMAYTITNSHTPEPEFVSVSVTKVWDDEDDADGIRPESVEVQLLQDGKAYGEPVTLDESNSWFYTWEGLDAEYDYQVVEVNVPDGYTASVTNDGMAYTITNSHTPELEPETTELTVNKVWYGDNPAVRPESILVQLTRNDEAYGEPVLLNEENGWSYTWTGLDVGFEWSVLEVNVPFGYEATYSTSESGTGTVCTITNAYTEEVSVIKVWDDEDDADGIRPDSVTVQLYRGMFPHGDPVTLDDSNSWSYTWTNLPLGYDYRVVEVGVPEGYDASYEQNGNVWTITNAHTPDEDFEIPEDDVPLAPGVPKGPDEVFEIPEDDVPLADVPKTGDDSHDWGFFALISGIGLALMALFRKKQEDSAE